MEEENRVLKDRPLLVQAGTQTDQDQLQVCVVGDSDTGHCCGVHSSMMKMMMMRLNRKCSKSSSVMLQVRHFYITLFISHVIIYV